jgi:uncharacterized membrane protein YccC
LLCPSYGLTKERSKDRIIGTLIGAGIAGIVLLTQNVVVMRYWHLFIGIRICIDSAEL